jgi:hypothetical protein
LALNSKVVQVEASLEDVFVAVTQDDEKLDTAA